MKRKFVNLMNFGRIVKLKLFNMKSFLKQEPLLYQFTVYNKHLSLQFWIILSKCCE